MKRRVTIFACLLLALAGIVQAQTSTGTTTLSVTIGPEAALTVNTGTTGLTNTGNFTSFTGTTSLTYFVRTSTSGTGSITSQVTTDFGSGGPSVAAPPAGDTLTYSCTVSAPGTACTGPITAKTTAATNVATFAGAAKSAKAGNSASVAWALPDDPQYAPGTYTATVTFTISAT